MRNAIAAAMIGFLTFPALTQQSGQSKPTLREPQGSPEQGRGATQAQQRPVFRGGTHFVRVDAYPIQDGRIVEDLEAEDFEVLEDGKPQKIESFDFVKFAAFTPDVERRDPRSQREGFDMAADPRNRVFVIFVDMAFSESGGAFRPTPDISYMHQPLTNFLDRILSPQDLYGFLTSRNSVKDLVLQRASIVTKSQIADLFRSSIIDKDEADQLFGCPSDPALIDRLKRLHRADATYSTLESLVEQLGSIRQERKSVILVTDLLPRWRPDRSLLEARGPALPRVKIAGGRIGTADRAQPEADEAYCTAESQRLANIDFDSRYRELLRDARKQNVSFYPITPGGLQAPATIGGVRAAQNATDDLKSVASETDGIAIVNTNDLNTGMKRIADDLAAYYVLGYYTTNTTWDGGIRNIKVRYKANGNPIRARRQYRAPTREEIAALASGAASASSPTVAAAASSAVAVATPVEKALTVLERASRPFGIYVAASGSGYTVVAELSAASIQAGRWKDGAGVEVSAVGDAGETIGTARGRIEPGTFAAAIPLIVPARPAHVSVRLSGDAASADDWVKLEPSPGKLLGDPLAFRSSNRAAPRPVAGFEFARNERIRVEWPVMTALDRREVRLLDHAGKPLPVELPLSEDAAKRLLVVEMSVSGLAHGDYVIELTAGAAGAIDRRLLAIRIR